MPSYFDTLQGDVPAWYTLGVSKSGALIIRVHPSCEAALHRLATKPPRVQEQATGLGLSPFIPPTKTRWGFGPVLTRHDDDEGWLRWQCPLQQILSGEEVGGEDHWDRGYAVSATLETLFHVLRFEFPATNTAIPQLLTIDGMAVERRMYGGALNATVSRRLGLWINQRITQGVRKEEAVITAMRRAYTRMWPRRIGRAEGTDFRCSYREPNLVFLDCPGNATGLGPDDVDSVSAESGYPLVPHNTDSPIHQLTLLWGLAALYQLAAQGPQ